MLRSTQSKVAAVLMAATMVMPSVAMATDKEMPQTAPAPAAEEKGGKEAPVLVEVKISREQAIEAVNKLFPIPAEMGTPNIGLSQNKSTAVWRMDWTTAGKSVVRKSINAEVDAMTGTVLRFSRSTNETQSQELNYSRSEAYKLAADWIGKLAGDRRKDLRYNDDPLQYGFYGGGSSFTFHWDRMEQGYPVQYDGYDITIDARTGELLNFSQNWRSTAAFKLPESLLSQEKAYAAYTDQLPMQLQYQRYQKPGTDKGEWHLVYRPTTGWPMVSMEGKLLDYQGQLIDFSKLGSTKLVPAADKAYVKPAKPLTPAEALAVAKAVTGRTDEPANLDCHEYGEADTKVRGCSFNWYKEGDESSQDVQINVETGLVTNMGNWSRMEPSNDAKPVITEEQARAMVVEFIRKYRPDLAGKVLLSPPMQRPVDSTMPIRSYYISLQMTHNLVPVAGQAAQFDVNAMTGKIQYFWADGMQMNEKEPLPAQTDLIKATAATEAFLKAKGLELTWVGIMSQEDLKRSYYVPGMDAMANAEMTLVWAPKRNLPVEALDAKTGALYDYNGRDLVQAAIRPVDIDGHPAQREIELLWARGVFDLKDGKFNPDQTVTAGELAQWLVLARGLQPYMSYDYALNFAGRGGVAAKLESSAQAPYFGAALQAGILLPEDFDENTDPSAPVSRELFALWAVRAMGFGDIAKMENRIAMPFADQAKIGAKYANAVAVLHGMKVIKGDATTNYGPQDLLTRGDAAKVLFAVASRGRMYPFYK